MASLPVHPLLPITSPCFQTTLTKQFLQQLSDLDQAKVLDLQNAFFPFKKKFKKLLLKALFLTHFTAFPPQTAVRAEPQGHCTAAHRQRDGVRCRNNSDRYCHQGQDVAEPQPYVLLRAAALLSASSLA